MHVKLICVLVCLATRFCFGQTEDCDLKRDSDGIQVYVCQSGSEKFKTLRAEFILENTSIEKYLEFLFSVEDYPNWQYNMVDADVLEKISDNEITYRSEVDAPWPVDDRELVVNLKVNQGADPDQIGIVIQNTRSDTPVKDGFIRVPFFFATYTINVINESSLKIIYNLKIDPGGSVPPWLVNIAMAEGPYVSFKNLKKGILEVRD